MLNPDFWLELIVFYVVLWWLYRPMSTVNIFLGIGSRNMFYRFDNPGLTFLRKLLVLCILHTSLSWCWYGRCAYIRLYLFSVGLEGVLLVWEDNLSPTARSAASHPPPLSVSCVLGTNVYVKLPAVSVYVWSCSLCDDKWVKVCNCNTEKWVWIPLHVTVNDVTFDKNKVFVRTLCALTVAYTQTFHSEPIKTLLDLFFIPSIHI